MEQQDFYPLFLAALLKGDHQQCELLSQQMQDAGLPFDQIYEQIFRPALYEVGRLWETNQISVATEHLATAITESLLNQILPTILPSSYSGKKIIVATVEGEQHKIGGQMVCDLFENHGWQSIFLGTDTATQDLISLIRQAQPDCIGLSMSVFFNFDKLQDMLGQIRQEFSELLILVGGQGFLHGGDSLLQQHSNIQIFTDLDSLKAALEQGKLDRC